MVQAAYEASNIGVYINDLLYDYFGNFQTITHGFNLADGLDVQFVISDFRNHNISPPAGYLQLQQEYACTSLFYSTRSIQLTTGSIPVNSEFIPSAAAIVGSSSGGSNNSRTIITDIEFNLGSELQSVKPYLQYTASSLYRMIDLTSSTPLRVIDIQVSYVDELGVMKPLMIAPNDSMTIKLAFVKKSVFCPTLR
jgi:hypothetical protein